MHNLQNMVSLCFQTHVCPNRVQNTLSVHSVILRIPVRKHKTMTAMFTVLVWDTWCWGYSPLCCLWAVTFTSADTHNVNICSCYILCWARLFSVKTENGQKEKTPKLPCSILCVRPESKNLLQRIDLYCRRITACSYRLCRTQVTMHSIALNS